jgi:hypothetical protein
MSRNKQRWQRGDPPRLGARLGQAVAIPVARVGQVAELVADADPLPRGRPALQAMADDPPGFRLAARDMADIGCRMRKPSVKRSRTPGRWRWARAMKARV